MSALVKAGDLRPDCDGFVSKRQVRTAMSRVGISGRVVRQTSDGNFDHLPGNDDEKRLNLFEMNTITRPIGGSPKAGAIEHFRSTGIRDVGPDAALYRRFDAHRRPGRDWTQLDVSKATAAFDVDPGATNIYNETGVHSNDVNADHPARTTLGCGPADSVAVASLLTGEADPSHKCFSNLHGSINFMFQEFGTPTGVHARMSAAEMRALFLHSEYPLGFQRRSPSVCRGGRFGCQSCFQQYRDTTPRGSDSPNATTTASPDATTTDSTDATAAAAGAPQWRHRYCRCMMAKDYEFSGGFSPTSGPNTEVQLPGVLASISEEYRATCVHQDPELYAGGRPAAGSFDRRAARPRAHA